MQPHRFTIIVLVSALLACPAMSRAETIWAVSDGETLLDFRAAELGSIGLRVRIMGNVDRPINVGGHAHFNLTIRPDSTLNLTETGGFLQSLDGGAILHRETVVFMHRHRRFKSDGFEIRQADGKPGTFIIGGRDGGRGDHLLELHQTKVVFDVLSQALFIEGGELVIADAMARRLGDASLTGRVIGSLLIRSGLVWHGGDAPTDASLSGSDPARGGSDNGGDSDGGTMRGGNQGTVCPTPVGPDVIVGDLMDVTNYPSLGGIEAFAVGTTSCNIGDENLSWVAGTNQHPVIGQNMFRLKNDRFVQIGQSWLKHGFFALTENACGCGCNGVGGSALGVGCSDPYCCGLNGQQGGLGPKSEVNPHTGFFPYPWINRGNQGDTGDSVYKRVQVRISDLDPTQDGGGTYFVEGHYVAPDDATAGNGNNNASYRPVTVSGSGSAWSIGLASSTVREKPGILAWHDVDPTVGAGSVHAPNDGRFWVAAKATNMGGGVWHYEYAIQNLNSDRSCGAFTVPITPGTVVFNVGFHDVDYHSGEPYDGTDWTVSVAGNSVTWATEDFNTNPDANALRWGTLYNFWFDCNTSLSSATLTLQLFKPGNPTSISLISRGPTGTLNAIDCGNGILDPGEECDDGNNVPGDGCFNCLLEAAPGNDNCINAFPIPEGTTSFFTYSATTDGTAHAAEGCTVGGDGGQTYNDVWFTYDAACSGTLTVSTCGSVNYNSDLVIYDGTDCANPVFLACNDDDPGCPNGSSLLTAPVVAGGSYLIRVGGGNAGDSGNGTITLTNDGSPCVPAGNPIRGGLIYDHWWFVNGAPAPMGDHPLYPPAGQQSGSITFRCKECHGWDYKGVNGAYGSGPHFTGIPGIFGSTMTAAEMFDIVKLDSTLVPNGHDFGNLGMSDQDISDVVDFMQTLLIDTDLYIDPNAAFLGDPVQGEIHYTSGGLIPCIGCHGPDGTWLNFGTPEMPEYVGTIAVHNPWELMHKIRIGQPASSMPSWVGPPHLGSDQGVADIGRYIQTGAFPVDCIEALPCDDLDPCTIDACVDGNCVNTPIAPDGDMDGVNGTNGEDIQFFVDAMINGPTPDQQCHGDFDGLNGLDPGDIPGMVNALITGP
ncbi:MAG: c-type cytochrome [Phycisphaerae bacterium]